MAKIAPDELWKLVVETGLCGRRQAAALRAEHDAAPAAAVADAKEVAGWLVEKGVLTRWQAKRVATGDVGPFFCGAYRLLERHEHDGDAFEFTARHEPSGRVVTVVLMGRRQWHEPAIREAITRRMTIATQAGDPLLVKAWALEEADGRPFAVCEEVRGLSLAEELAQRGPLPLREAGEIVLATARAVAGLHAAGDVHGGLSLDALVREPAAAGGRLRLRQFPLATDPHQVPPRALVANEAELLFLGRRAAFVAPELASGAACDARSDVYALGCILHALVRGAAPGWSGDAGETIAQAARTGLERLDPAVAPAPLATLVEYLTARDPQDRYADAAEAARAIAICFGFPEPEFSLVPAPAAAPAVAAVVDAAAVRPDPAEASRRRGRALRLAGGALAAAVLAILSLSMALRRSAPPQRPAEPAVAHLPADAADAADTKAAADGGAETPPAQEAATATVSPVIVDDPSLPWASPTSGPPPTLAYLPAGSQLIVVARPAELLADDEGRLLVRSLGPGVEAALAGIAATCGCTPAQIETLEIGWQSGETGEPVVGWAVRLVEGATLPADDDVRTRSWGAAAERDGETTYAGPKLSYWAPASAAGRVLVAAPAARLAELVEAAAPAGPPPLALPADMERLAARLDAARHLTVFGSPYTLLNDGRGLIAEQLAPLVDGLDALLGEGVQAAALSVHCGADFYMELDAIAVADLQPAVFALRLAERIAGFPAAARAFCASRELHPYGRALVMELPTMVRALAANVRAGAEGKVVVVNVYLPRHAGHNIALATELALAQAAAGPAGAPAAAAPADALGRLGRTMTLSFAKDTLEKSIQMISEEVGVPMEILGTDLQLEGITKNQSFALDERDKPAADILRVILAKANPDGKLVYVVRKKDGVESIEITTRAAAAKRGDALPPVFEEGGPPPQDPP